MLQAGELLSFFYVLFPSKGFLLSHLYIQFRKRGVRFTRIIYHNVKHGQH